MQKETARFQPSDLLEGMTSISALFRHECPENDRKVLKIWVDTTKRKSKIPEISFLTAKSYEYGFPIEFVEPKQLDEITVGNTHGGIVAFCSARTIPELTPQSIAPIGFYVYLEGIEDPYNFGNAVRSLYAAGVTGIVVPPRNWMSASGVVARASGGTSERIQILSATPETLIPSFREKKYRILCAGIRDSVSVFDQNFPFPILLVIGGEKRGISRKILDQADQVLRIDYGRDFRGSLSAAASAAVLAFELMRQNQMH